MKELNNLDFTEKFRLIYSNLYTLHPQIDNDEFRYRYLRVDWFFPQHIHNVISQIRNLGSKYFTNIDIEAALYGGLLHDAGLVYKREFTSPIGHEDRSIEYTQNELTKYGYSKDFIEKVCECIRATEPGYKTELPEALLVRNADAYAHMISMHFFAKSNFNKDIDSFVNWFSNKLKTTYSKLTIPELRKGLDPIVNFYESMIKNYKENKDNHDFIGLL